MAGPIAIAITLGIFGVFLGFAAIHTQFDMDKRISKIGRKLETPVAEQGDEE